MTLMNKLAHITKLKFNFEAELRGTNPGEIRDYWKICVFRMHKNP